MHTSTRFAVQHAATGDSPYVMPVRSVGRIRIRSRMRRARADFLPLYLSAGVAGVACGFLLSVV